MLGAVAEAGSEWYVQYFESRLLGTFWIFWIYEEICLTIHLHEINFLIDMQNNPLRALPLLVSPCRSYSPGRWRASWGRRRPPAAAPRPPGPGSSPACGRCFCSSSSALCECLQPDSAADTEQLQDQTQQRQQGHQLFQAKTVTLVIILSVLLSL